MLVVRSARETKTALLRRPAALLAARARHSDSAALLRESVRKLDYDNYVCGLLFPQDTRAAFFALRAMNAEIATIKDTIRSNPATGKIRMQWWRERIYSLYDSGRGGAQRAAQETLVLRELAKAVDQHNLTRRWFERLLDARDQDLDVDQPQTLRELEVYADKTAASLLYLALECLDVRDANADRAAGHAGVAIGLATLLRGTPHHLARQQLYLPEELIRKHALSDDDIVAATSDPEKGKRLAPVVFDIACRAMEHLHLARSLRREVPAAARPALLPLVPAASYLEQLERVNFNVFDPSLSQSSPLQLHLQILKHYFLRDY
ncbi:hypothetical protein P43SY_004788 [Pythium insidiosum]|uniref:15-cis-phytoene synthase n=1 Tax=Pythium insidiosum TaxID=114742 RepID=A0AAD5QDU8_PYTIN|nr:hypothetical protein P43SY_004788 [Pythium insidiosum]